MKPIISKVWKPDRTDPGSFYSITIAVTKVRDGKDSQMKAIKIVADTIAILLVSICCAKECMKEDAAG